MTRRNLLIAAAWLLCIGTVSAVLLTRSHLADLRARQSSATQPVAAANPPESGPQADPSTTTDASDTSSRELMQLRAQVTRLTARKRELADVAETSARLRAQLDTPQTNSGTTPLPPGYIRRSNAQFRGFSTPEASLESWLCALHNHDFTNMLRALSPDQLQHYQARMALKDKPADFFKETDILPGLAIQSRRDLPDGSVELQVFIAPNMPPQNMKFHLVNGEWKMGEW